MDALKGSVLPTLVAVGATVLTLFLASFGLLGQFATKVEIYALRADLKTEIEPIRAEQGRRTAIVYGMQGRFDSLDQQLQEIKRDLRDIKARVR